LKLHGFSKIPIFEKPNNINNLIELPTQSYEPAMRPAISRSSIRWLSRSASASSPAARFELSAAIRHLDLVDQSAQPMPSAAAFSVAPKPCALISHALIIIGVRHDLRGRGAISF
jgi:hypothetical protein